MAPFVAVSIFNLMELTFVVSLLPRIVSCQTRQHRQDGIDPDGKHLIFYLLSLKPRDDGLMKR